MQAYFIVFGSLFLHYFLLPYSSRGYVLPIFCFKINLLLITSYLTVYKPALCIFRGTAVGCSNLVLPSDAWLRRTDNEATIGCYTTRQRWNLRCDGNRWTGTVGVCSTDSHGSLQIYFQSLPLPTTVHEV